MHRSVTGVACALVLACAQPAWAADFHPLVSLTLPGGVHEYDNIIIPAGVTLSFGGEDRQATLRARDTLTLEGSLVAPGWTLILEAQHLQLSGLIDAGGGTTGPGDIPIVGRGAGFGGLVSEPGGHIGLGGGGLGGVYPPSPLDLTGRDRGGDLVIHGPGGLTLVGGQGGSGIVIQTPVPEPETWAMLLAGLGLVGLAVRRNRGDTKL